jgi:hypothetical protein
MIVRNCLNKDEAERHLFGGVLIPPSSYDAPGCSDPYDIALLVDDAVALLDLQAFMSQNWMSLISLLCQMTFSPM